MVRTFVCGSQMNCARAECRSGCSRHVRTSTTRLSRGSWHLVALHPPRQWSRWRRHLGLSYPPTSRPWRLIAWLSTPGYATHSRAWASARMWSTRCLRSIGVADSRQHEPRERAKCRSLGPHGRYSTDVLEWPADAKFLRGCARPPVPAIRTALHLTAPLLFHSRRCPRPS